MNKRSVGIFAALVAFSLAGSLYARLSGLDPAPIARPVGVLTLAAACNAAFGPLVVRRRGLWALGAVTAIGATSEVIGLLTGYPFGRYAYTDRWWPVVHLASVGNYPLQLPFAWVLVAGGSYLAVESLPGAVWIGAALSMLIDGIMEPTMTRALGYWKWDRHGPLPGGAPILNAAGWFVVSLLAAWSIRVILGSASRRDLNSAIVLGLYVLLVVGLGVIAG